MTHCPRCQSALPDPPERFCPNCGVDLALGQPPLPGTLPPPSSAWADAGGARDGTPWERRHQIGFLSALVETTQRVLTAPAAFFRSMSVTGGVGSPLLYAVLVGYAGIVISSIYDFVLESVMGSSFSRMGGGTEAMARVMPFLQGGIALGLKLVLGPVILAVGLFLWSAIVHVALLALGGASRGYEATFRVVAYAGATAVLNIIPICGGALAGVYSLVLVIIGVSEAHGITRGRAAAAVLLPLALCCCCALIPFVIGMGSIMSQINK
jgi:hypothetical protein